jgi:hypothetical protein
MSASGKRAYISLTSEDGYRYAMYVDPKRLAPRLPFAAPAAEPPCEHFNTESGFCSKCGECLMRDDESKHGA